MMRFIKSAVVTAFSLFLLSACITETSNPVFNVEESEDSALEDYLLLSIGYLEQGDLANTKRHLANVARIDSNNSKMFGVWGLVYAREGEPALAEQNFNRSLRLDSANSQIRNNYAAFLFSEGRIDDAYEQLARVVQDTGYEQRPQAFENMGIAALRLNRIEDADQAFSRALQLNPNQLRSALELVVINMERGDILQARAYWRNYLTLIQFFNVGHNARSLLIGARLELAMQNEVNAFEYGDLLETNFPDSREYELFQQAME
jgi:type IV pilus assembly protein PilF